MNELNVRLINCYGIPKLVFDFKWPGRKTTTIIYASNGSMKTSFAKTFEDIEKGRESKDEIFQDRVTSREVLKGQSERLEAEDVVVVKSYNSSYSSKSISTLLVNEKLRSKYEESTTDIDTKFKQFIKALNVFTKGSKPNTENLLIEAFTDGSESSIVALTRLKVEMEVQEPDLDLIKIPYTTIFNSRTEKLLSDPSFLSSLLEYIVRYDEIIKSSRFFRRGVFDHNNAEAVYKELKSNRFFEANHAVRMSQQTSGSIKIIDSEDELRKVLDEELQAIKSDAELNARFEKIDSQLQRSKDVTALRELLKNNPEVISRLRDPKSFKRQLLKCYIKELDSEYLSLVSVYVENQKKIQGIIAAAEREKTIWASVVKEFNDRFKVPFTVQINQGVFHKVCHGAMWLVGR